ncbi:uncharacterized protein LOC123660932 [Melitaea cinxia]|uniref:uncharacterized protein LOC123660932 n=1 Tax=Melitaea cinxia TaxID=113334 RepID=UPI001E274709|nr:uncharacterized protein LOC123660932 [Melitaea cinxia]
MYTIKILYISVKDKIPICKPELNSTKIARMELPVLDKFCFIFNLKTGCIIMGTVNSILTFLMAVILIAFAVDIKQMSDSKKDDIDGMSTVVYTIVVLIVILLLIKFLSHSVFVWAVYKERAGVIKKYCIFWIVFLVLFIIGFLKTMVHMSAGHVIAQILFLAENFYYIIVIRSYLMSINEDGVL